MIILTLKSADGAMLDLPVHEPSITTRYVATLTLGSTVYTFDSANAVDQGDYVGEFVRQKSLMVALPGCPFTVFFRPDVDGTRDEVVVELGKMWSGAPAHVRTPYTLSVTKDGAPLFTQNVPYHWWWSRWRWQSAPRSFVRDAASLMAANYFLPHSKDYLYGYKPGGPYAYFANYAYTPMGLGGLVHGMGTGGDRPELGPLTKPQADFLLFGTPLARDVMLAQAEASASLPFHIRDEKTGAWLNNRAKPYHSLHPNSPVPRVPNPAVPIPQVTTFAYMQTAHMPQLTYAPYLLTDDPYYLEELQAVALYHTIESSGHQIVQKLPGLAQPGETRGMAWGIRDIALAAKATPATVPSWLSPQSLYLANLADNRTYIQRYMDSPALIHKVFRAFTRSDLLGSFQEDYKAIVLAWVARMFPEQWKDAYVWAMGAIMPLVTDGSGWLKGWPCPYYFAGMVKPLDFSTLIKDTSQDANTYKTWAEAFQQHVAVKGRVNDPTLASYPPAWDGVSIMQTLGSAGYVLWRQGAIHLAQGHGIAGAAAAAEWFDGQIPAIVTKFRNTNDPRWSFSAN